jgi:conjugal transfer mating pair stabilization protein TraN
VSTKTVVISPATLVFNKIDDLTLEFTLPLNEPVHHAGRSITTSQKQRRKSVF